jgi:hypothetical protein
MKKAMALVSVVQDASSTAAVAEEKQDRTVDSSTTSTPACTHDAKGGVDLNGRPWPKPYYLEDGFRRVHPYYHTYNTYAKGRWRNREILDIFASEFRDRTAEYYVRVALHDLLPPKKPLNKII